MSTSPLGDCVVCGAKTAKRCSDCAKFGTDWMYFCSQEHQKLLWKVHKRVCGNNSNPFRFPPLSEDEIQNYTKLSQKRFRMKPGSTPAVSSWCEALFAAVGPDQLATTQALGLSQAEAFEHALRTIGVDNEGEPRPIKQLNRDIQKIRCDSWKAQVCAVEQATGQSLDIIKIEQSGSNLFGHLASEQVILETPNFDDQDQVYSEWWSRFNHLTLIRLVVVNLFLIDPSEENRAYLNHSQSAVEQFIDSTPGEVIQVVRRFKAV